MTNITGKIYQMQNAAGTENRFPRTVMEAVLGLNSYLQDQFSALADIYMPIEGISEVFTGQEFVYRKSPNTIKAKSLTLDRIKGKSLAWNQLVASPNGENNRDYTPKDCTIIYNATNKESTIAISGTPNDMWIRPKKDGHDSDYDDFIAGHRYLFQVYAKAENAIGEIIFGQTNYNLAPRSFYSISKNATTSYQHFTVVTPVMILLDSYGYVRLGSKNPASTTGNIIYKNLQIIDLTLLYGTEIDGLTDEQILAKYEADFGTGYYEYNAGELISNDAEAVETTGVNQWDEEWEYGWLELSTGVVTPFPSGGTPSTVNHRIVSKNLIPVFPGTAYYVYFGEKEKAGDALYLVEYDADGNYLTGSQAQRQNTIFTTGVNTRYLRFMNYYYDISYANDICINISDESINGQYFTYWKRTQNLGLNEFKVKDSQGNITTITGGLKSAGSVYDEIVGNKYIKRVGSVDMGSLEWEYVYLGTANEMIRSKQAVSGIKSGVSSVVSNIICGTYTAKTENQLYGHTAVGISVSGTGNVVVYDANYASGVSTIDAFTTAMQGVILYYELATPIEYDLVEPLIYTTKAGTTEERISPNSDGLSAPFCCDMTYSANENNDAGNAQYAATAGRLLNTRKIWGQDFNGSEDVDGNLVSNGILQGTQLKSTVPTGTAPLVVSSTTTVANLVAEKASKLLTARTIWGQNFDGSGDISGAISNITTLSASGLATIAGGIALGTSTKAQAATMIWDETNNAWHLQGNLYADGSISAKGTINNNTDYVTQQQYNELVSRIEALEG